MLGDMLRRGTKQHTFQQITDQFDGLEAAVNFTSGMGSLEVSVKTTRENLPAVLKLVDEVLRQPTLPAAELETIRKDRLSGLEEAKTDPQQLAVTAFRRKLFPHSKDDVRYVPTIEEKIERIKAVKLDDIKKLASMLGGTNAQFVIVGDFDAKAVGEEAAQLWDAWKSPRPWKRVENKYQETVGSEETIDTPDKENALMIAGLGLQLRDDDADFPALEVVNYVLGGSGFTSRLMKRLREKEGLSYGAGSQMQADSIDQVGVIICFALLAPQNTVKGMASLVDEVQRISDSGITAEELATAKTGYVKEFERSLSSDGFVANLLEESLYLNRGLDYYSKLTSKVGTLTLEQVNAAAKKWVKPSALVRVTGADKKKAAGTPAAGTPAAPAPTPATPAPAPKAPAAPAPKPSK
jgi:zinc protease